MPRIQKTDVYWFEWNIKATRSTHVQEITLKALQAGQYDGKQYRYIRVPITLAIGGTPAGYRIFRYRRNGEYVSGQREDLLTAYFRRII